MKSEKKHRWSSVVATCLLLVPLLSFHGRDFITRRPLDCQHIFDEAKTYENGNNAGEACKGYFRICNECDNIENIVLVDKAYQKAGKLTQRYISETYFPDDCQRYAQGIIGVDTWTKYISWYYLQSDSLQKVLAAGGGGKIEQAIVDLGETIKKRGQRPANCKEDNYDYAQLFDLYNGYEAKHLTKASVNIWIGLLLSCKDNQWTSTPMTLTQWAAAYQNNPGCASAWNDFKNKLEEWINSKNGTSLSSSDRTQYINKLATLKSVLGN